MGYEKRVLYSSFNHKSVLKVREYNPKARLAFLHSHEIAMAAEYAKINQVHALNPSVTCTLYEDEIRECQKQNIDINVWTVNSETDMQRLVDMGVNAIITNYPDVGRKIVNEMNG